jgi:hypothetical protein
LKIDCAEQAPDDKRDIGLVPYDSAVIDCLDFWGRKLETYKDGFTEAETKAFVNHAIGLDNRARWQCRRGPDHCPALFENAGTRERALRGEESRRRTGEASPAARDSSLSLCSARREH